MAVPKALDALIGETVTELDDNWDIDEDMPASRMHELAYSRLLLAMYDEGREVLSWLTFFVARRAVSCWEANTDDPRLPARLKMLSDFYLEGHQPNWALLRQPVPSPFRDCRYSDTQSAADSVAWAAAYAYENVPSAAVYCVSSADVAYDHVLTDHEFRRWFLEVALPASFKKTDLSLAEQHAYRPRSTLLPAGR